MVGVWCATRSFFVRMGRGCCPRGVCRGGEARHCLGEEGGMKRGEGSVMVLKMFGYEEFIYKLCSDFTYPPIWPGWNWRD